jgi:hypothetical protein
MKLERNILLGERAVHKELANSGFKQRFQVAPPVRYMEDEDVFALDSIDYEIASDGKASQAMAQVSISSPTKKRMRGKKKESRGNGVHQSIGNLRIATFPCDVRPDFYKFGFDLRGKEERHELRLLAGLEPGAATALYFPGEFPRRLLGEDSAFTVAERRFSLLHRRENFDTPPLAFLPELQGFLDGVLGTGNAAIFNGLADEGFLIRAEFDSHFAKRRFEIGSCQA